MGVVDIFVAYKFIKILATPFEETEAYKLGIIDADGKILIPRKKLKTGEQRAAYTIFHTIGFNLKRIINRIPVLRSRFGSIATALWLLKEDTKGRVSDFSVIEHEVMQYLYEQGISREDFLVESINHNTILGRGSYLIKGKEVTLMSPLHSVGTMLGYPIFEHRGMTFTESEVTKNEETS